MVKRFLAVLSVGLAAVATWLRLKSESERAERAEQSAKKAQQALDHRILLETKREQLTAHQQQELKDVQKSFGDGDRSHFNNDGW